MSRNCLVSVASYSYLPKAITMAESFAAYNQDSDVFILVPDMSQSKIDSVKWSVPTSTKILGVDVLDDPLISMMHQYFDAFEFCCALKSFLLKYILFIKKYDNAVMLDPDIMCYGSFDEIWLELKKADIILSPHTNTPMPDDGELPDDLEYITAGFINGGFMAARQTPNAEKCLDWLINKVSDFGFFAPQFNLYSDQTWMSSLPWFFPEAVCVSRHYGVNVAYWNLHERTLLKVKNGYSSNDKQLVFFHYSGFQEGGFLKLTKHSNRTFNAETNTVVSELLADYDLRIKEVLVKIPQLIPDIPFVKLVLSKRLKVFKSLRGKAVKLSHFNQSFAKKLIKFTYSIVRRCLGSTA